MHMYSVSCEYFMCVNHAVSELSLESHAVPSNIRDGDRPGPGLSSSPLESDVPSRSRL